MIKKIYLLLIISVSMTLQAQGFYDLNTIQKIEITFAESNWDYLLDQQKAGDEDYIMAQSVTINDIEYDSVGVKYKGNSTYSANQTKNPFHIELDTYKEQDYEGYKDIKLSNVANDPSFLREVLSYYVVRQYMDAPQSNYANVYVNGNLMGLYSNSEAITKSFVKTHFYSKSNTFIKCNPPGGAGQQGSDYPNLVYLGTDSTDYYDSYEVKSDAGWGELIDFCDTITNHFDHIEEILDVDRALWMLAFDNTLVNLDSYIGAFAQNYYLYRDDNGLFIPIVWDLNESFGRFSQTGSSTLNSTSDKQKMDHLLHDNDSDHPLAKQLLSNATYKRMYIAHMKTMLLENFDNNNYYTVGQELQDVIDAAVKADGNNFFDYSAFTSNLVSDYSSSGGGPGQTSSTCGIKSLMEGRSSYLLALSDFTATAPSIAEVQFSSPSPIVGETLSISVDVTDATTVYLAYRYDEEDVFQKVTMSGASTYTYDLAVEDTYIEYYIYAENNDAGMFSPQKAQHEFYTIEAEVETPTLDGVVINEFMASNDATASDQDDEADDWIELYNNSSSTVDLSGYFLSDDADEISQWTFPSGTKIESDSYLIVWADKDEDQEGLHTSFKLSATEESIYLSDADTAILDFIEYSDQTTDISYARIPNGTGDFQASSPSFGTENTTSTGLDNTAEEKLNIYPNPASGTITISASSSTSTQQAVIYNATGQIITQLSFSNSATVDVSSWMPGVYFILSEQTSQAFMVQ